MGFSGAFVSLHLYSDMSQFFRVKEINPERGRVQVLGPNGLPCSSRTKQEVTPGRRSKKSLYYLHFESLFGDDELFL